ncbi:hypothetical protein DFH09DRAFT_1075470 [Mycena vulgaris]|nr:hypothetical protein DFH09DRAFT_1075470 [Mycena vulgaris]
MAERLLRPEVSGVWQPPLSRRRAPPGNPVIDVRTPPNITTTVERLSSLTNPTYRASLFVKTMAILSLCTNTPDWHDDPETRHDWNVWANFSARRFLPSLSAHYQSAFHESRTLEGIIHPLAEAVAKSHELESLTIMHEADSSDGAYPIDGEYPCFHHLLAKKIGKPSRLRRITLHNDVLRLGRYTEHLRSLISLDIEVPSKRIMYDHSYNELPQAPPNNALVLQKHSSVRLKARRHFRGYGQVLSRHASTLKHLTIEPGRWGRWSFGADNVNEILICTELCVTIDVPWVDGPGGLTKWERKVQKDTIVLLIDTAIQLPRLKQLTVTSAPRPSGRCGNPVMYRCSAYREVYVLPHSLRGAARYHALCARDRGGERGRT